MYSRLGNAWSLKVGTDLSNTIQHPTWVLKVVGTAKGHGFLVS